MLSQRRKLRLKRKAESESDLRSPELHSRSRGHCGNSQGILPVLKKKYRMPIEFSFKAVVENTSFCWRPGLFASLLCGLDQETSLPVPRSLLLQNRNNKISHLRDFPSGPLVMTLLSNAGDAGLISGQGTKIPHTTGQLSLHVETIKPMLL